MTLRQCGLPILLLSRNNGLGGSGRRTLESSFVLAWVFQSFSILDSRMNFRVSVVADCPVFNFFGLNMLNMGCIKPQRAQPLLSCNKVFS